MTNKSSSENCKIFNTLKYIIYDIPTSSQFGHDPVLRTVQTDMHTRYSLQFKKVNTYAGTYPSVHHTAD